MVRESDIKRWMFYGLNKFFLSLLSTFGLAFILSKINIGIDGLEVGLTFIFGGIYSMIDKAASLNKRVDKLLEKDKTFAVLLVILVVLFLDYYYGKNDAK